MSRIITAVEQHRDLGRSPVKARRLSPAEWRVLSVMARGEGPVPAAEELGRSFQTVKNHLTHIYQKLEVTNLVQAFAAVGWLRVPGAETNGERQAIWRAREMHTELAHLVDRAEKMLERLDRIAA